MNYSTGRSCWLCLALAALLSQVGCEQRRSGYGYGPVDPASFQFNDAAETNADLPQDVGQLTFLDRGGQAVALADYRDKKNVVLVFLRGFSGEICPYCQTQSSRLIANYQQFADRDAEILLVYPGDPDTVGPFLEAVAKAGQTMAADVPFPVLLDEGLKAVDFFQIRDNLALPATFILDRQGAVRFAYVGSGVSDRPSVKALLAQLDLVQGKSAAGEPEASAPG